MSSIVKYVTTKEYMAQTGRNYTEVMSMIKTGELEATRTAGGGKYLIKQVTENPPEVSKAEFDKLYALVSRIADRFGITPEDLR